MICITGSTYAYFALTASSNNITGSVGGAGLSLTVTKKFPTANKNMIPQLESTLDKAISNEYSCIDGNGNMVCQVYQATVTNSSSVAAKVNGTIRFEGIDDMPNLKWKRIDEERTIGGYSSNTATTEPVIFDENKLFNAGTTENYYFVIWIDEIGRAQYDQGTFRAIIEFNSADDGLTSTITDVLDIPGEMEEEKLAPGLYKDDGTFISWEDLTSTEYQSFDLYTNWNGESSTSSILTVDENGVLRSAYEYDVWVNLSADYLNGKLIIPNSVTSIEEHVFESCSNLTSVLIPSSVTSIGDNAFSHSGITSITIPSSVTSIASTSFSGCSGLTSIVVDEKNSVYDSRNNSNAIIETATDTLFVGCENTIFPEGITSIGDYAFDERIGLTSITIPSSVMSIGKSAFYGCSGLTSVLIPSSVTSVGNYAFFGLGITSITIPSSVTNIGANAFAYCRSLKTVYFEHIVAPTFGYGCFDKNAGDNCTFYFKNSTVSDALIDGEHYNNEYFSYGTKSTNYNW